MKKLFVLIVSISVLLALAACDSGNANGGDGKKKELIVGASPTPHAEILEKAKPILEKKGVNLKIKKFQDYVTPNKSLGTGSLDANFYQTKPFLKGQNKEFGYDFVNVGAVHLEPIGGYSKKYDNIKELPDGAKILISSNTADYGRILKMLDQHGLIKLKKGAGYNASFDDIAKNPKHLKFKHDIDPSLMAKTYKKNEGDLVFINTNYAVDAGLNPTKDAIVLEGKDSPYANIVVTKKKDRDNEAIQKLVNVLQSKKIQQFIKDKWHGQIVPVKLDKGDK